MGFMGWNVTEQAGWANPHLSWNVSAIRAAREAFGRWTTLYDDLPATIIARGAPTANPCLKKTPRLLIFVFV